MESTELDALQQKLNNVERALFAILSATEYTGLTNIMDRKPSPTGMLWVDWSNVDGGVRTIQEWYKEYKQ